MNEYPVIGMSPGNSYFKDEVVESLLRKVVDQYEKTATLIADIPAISTYVALGYPANRARRDKALPQWMLFGAVVIYDIDGEGHMLRKEIRCVESVINA